MIPLFSKFCQSDGVGEKGHISNRVFFISKVEHLSWVYWLSVFPCKLLVHDVCPFSCWVMCFLHLLRGGLYNIVNIDPLFTVCCKCFLLAWHLASDSICIVFHPLEWMRDTERALIFPCWFRALVTEFQGWTGIKRTIQRCPQGISARCCLPYGCCFIGGLF